MVNPCNGGGIPEPHEAFQVLKQCYVMVDGDYGSWEMGHVIVYSYKRRWSSESYMLMCNLWQFLVLISLSSAHTALESKNKYNAGDISGYSGGKGSLNIYLGPKSAA